MDELDGVVVISPYSEEGSHQISEDGTIGYAALNFEDRPLEELIETGDTIQELGNDVATGDMRIEYGGDVFYAFEMPASEALGILAAVIILLIAFGSVLAMGLPIGTALAGLLSGMALVALASNVATMPDFTTAMAAMIGLGVGIDYALFIVTRHREGLHDGLSPEEAAVASIDTSGRAVMFAGGTVIISLCGLFIAGLAFVNGIALASICAVLAMLVASLTLLPALLAFSGNRIEVTTYRGVLGLIVPVLLAIPAIIFGIGSLVLVGLVFSAVIIIASFFIPKLRSQVPVRRAHGGETGFWWRWSKMIQRRPWPAAGIGVVVLLVLAIPLFSIRLGFGDAGNYPESTTPRQAYDLLAKGFGPGFNGPLLVLVQDPDGIEESDLGGLMETIGSTEGVAAVFPGGSVNETAALITVIPTGSPQDEATSDLVKDLRENVLPDSGMDAKVGGFAAANVDFSTFLADRLPLIMATVLVLSFLLLMLVFRSLLVPLKAVIVNLLSIGAAYGVVVAIFQWGWAKDLIGIDKAGPVEAWVPMMLFAIVFGLSMDYEVFLLSRIKEEYDRTGDNESAVADGLAVTARVITAAALIMVCVFGSFVLGEDRQLKLFGLGLAVAVLLDATIVRMVLVPATMELLGDRNWWIPKWLDRILPHVHIEARAEASPPPSEPPSEPEQRTPETVG